MKRLIACAALLLVAVAFVVLNQARELQALGKDDGFYIRRDSSLPLPDYAVGEATPASEPNPLREELLEHVKAKIDLMSDEEIKQALQAAKTEILERQAEKRLDDVIKSLGSIKDDFEGTNAAAKAAKLLNFHQHPDNRTAPYSDSTPSYYPPTPVGAYEKPI